MDPVVPGSWVSLLPQFKFQPALAVAVAPCIRQRPINGQMKAAEAATFTNQLQTPTRAPKLILSLLIINPTRPPGWQGMNMDGFHDLIRNQALLSSACAKPATKPAESNAPSATPEHRYRCMTCGHAFSRAEHLKRHQTTRMHDSKHQMRGLADLLHQTPAPNLSPASFVHATFPESMVVPQPQSGLLSNKRQEIGCRLITVAAHGVATGKPLNPSPKAGGLMRASR
jgi:hypothetical protein